ncbi:aminotransferase class I/II-fold pyridoxal phosphate-dependent enzyme [Dickeya solani]|uniref:Aspartate aminotransferase A protein n=1 Tax=Dickeya solani D s0432-1 TaxID=1231725 RepID=A0AAV3K785_9GAMM|nr:aminotransferase class I/II-fold pyridoxal phosphate-dependent enzyme [Dickeya solani]ANE74294.1 aspartate aminotransferase [Dickeya solani IPO 2222]AUC41507.1 Aspartate aminotransferase [Dickeya solani RNS 08.23.3.1.A]AUH10292.1 aspartate aminotransferase [Dickeya solani D s0432-1]AUH14235.1 aspartate aminotransferase [Dickeya solani]AYQ48753.1 Aspartate aminotransferase [Dickeya solani]
MTDSAWLSHRLKRIKPSPSIAANELVSRLRSEGKDIINFTIGEPDFDTPQHIIDAAITAMTQGETHYTSASGTVALRNAIAQKLKRDNRLDYGLNEIVCGSGGKHIIFHAFAATLNAQDEVIIHAPYWVSYPDLAVLNDAFPVVITGDEVNQFKLTPEALSRAITPATKWVVINYPNNPSGAVYSHQELSRLAEVLRQHPHVLIMLDEIYEHFVYDGHQHISMAEVAPDLRDRLLIVNGASKGYAMTGWCLGFGAGPAWLISAMAKLLSQTTTCPSSVSQAAAVAAFAGEQQPVKAMLEVYKARRDVVVSALSDIPGISFAPPAGAFYLYVNVGGLLGKVTASGKALESDDDVVEYLLAHGGVATVGGRAYGMSPFLRISFASSLDAINEGCRRIKTAVSQLS